MKKTTVIEIEYNDLEEIIEDHWGKEFSIPADLECGNDTYHLFKVEPQEIDEYEQQRVNKWLGIETTYKYYPTWLTSTLLNHLCFLGKLEEGDYLVEISW